MDKPESEVKVRIARCGKCSAIVFVGLEHLLDKRGNKELSDCVKAGCNIETMPLLDYKKLKTDDWCNTKCNK